MELGRDYLVFDHTDVLARARVDARRRGIRGSIISLVMTLVFLGVLMFVERDLLQATTVRAFSATFIGIGLIGVIVSVALFVVTRRDLERIQPGPALVVDRAGLDVAGQRIAWPDLASFTTRNRRVTGPQYVIIPHGGVPIILGVEHLANFPATLDTAVRIFSDGQGAIDLSGIDH